MLNKCMRHLQGHSIYYRKRLSSISDDLGVSMSESVDVMSPEEIFLHEVSQMTPEDAMNVLKQNIVENWWRRITLWPDNYDAPWVEAYKAIQLLEQSPGPEALAELGADYSEGFTSRAITRLWDKLEEDQRKRVLRSIKRGIALNALEYFFDSLLRFLRSEVSVKGGDVLAKQILEKAHEFIDEKISFDDLMTVIADLIQLRNYQRAYEPYMKTVALGRYVNSRDLKKLVSKFFALSSAT